MPTTMPSEEGIPFRKIADVIGTGLQVPVRSITPGDVCGYFGPIAGISGADMVASSTLTRREPGWRPIGPGLLEDLRRMVLSPG